MKMKAALALFLSFGTVHFSEGLESCPKVSSNQTGICVEECSKDSDCKSNLKCCSNGCGHVCTQPVSVPCNGSRPLTNQTTGQDLYCGRGGQRCPNESYCDIHPTDQYAKCCPNTEVLVPCSGVRPLTNKTTGQDLYCGRGGQPCPKGSYCDIHPTDKYAKCCPNKDQGPCDGNKPLTNSTTGQDLYCGRGGQPCPKGSYCDIHPTDKYAKCCPNKDPGPCDGNKPLTNSTTGQDLYCGRGGQRCPKGSYCDIHPTDKYAKCCPNKAATALLGNQWSVLSLAYPTVLLFWSFSF